MKVGQLGKLLKALKKFDAAYAVMAGQITPGKLFKGLHPDLKAVSLLASLKKKRRDYIRRYRERNYLNRHDSARRTNLHG